MAARTTVAQDTLLLLAHQHTTTASLVPPVTAPIPQAYVQPPLPLEDLGPLPERPPADRRHERSRVARQVDAFHRAFSLPRQSLPTAERLPDALLRLREALLDEEVAEYAYASHRRDLAKMADALGDIVYVAYGSALTLGIDLDRVLDEVHRSNMSKLDQQGRPVLRDDGKVLKSPKYTPPDVGAVLASQPPLSGFHLS